VEKNKDFISLSNVGSVNLEDVLRAGRNQVDIKRVLRLV
jgi:hypothetical protein